MEQHDGIIGVYADELFIRRGTALFDYGCIAHSIRLGNELCMKMRQSVLEKDWREVCNIANSLPDDPPSFISPELITAECLLMGVFYCALGDAPINKVRSWWIAADFKFNEKSPVPMGTAAWNFARLSLDIIVGRPLSDRVAVSAGEKYPAFQNLVPYQDGVSPLDICEFTNSLFERWQGRVDSSVDTDLILGIDLAMLLDWYSPEKALMTHE